MLQVRKVKPVLSLWCGETGRKVEADRSSGQKRSQFKLNTKPAKEGPVRKLNNINKGPAKKDSEKEKKSKVSPGFPGRIALNKASKGDISDVKITSGDFVTSRVNRVSTTTSSTTTITTSTTTTTTTTIRTKSTTTTTTLPTLEISSTTG